MLNFLLKRWFLTSLVLLLVLGIWFGIKAPANAHVIAESVNPLLATTAILFLMSFSLETRQLRDALRTPLPVVLGSVLNMGLAPLLGMALMGLQTTPDFRYGLLAASVAPCTMAAASVWTRKAHGNDAISLLVTLVTNLASIVVIPVWLVAATQWFPLEGGGAAQSEGWSGSLLDLEKTVYELIVGVLIPIGIGQLLRQPAALNALANRHKISLGNLAQALILVMVLTAALKGGVRIAGTRTALDPVGILLVWGSVIVVHVVTLYAGLYLSRTLGVARPDQIAVAFACSQKTLPVGLLICESISEQAGLSFAVFPMLMYHASQLSLDTIIADRFVSAETQPAKKP